MKTDKIDFVILWVDNADPQWQQSYFRAKGATPDENEKLRFRDWGLLRYWFRGVEKFAPWVNRVFLITVGHYPQWLNLIHPKLRLVKHSDYIPNQYLPTFNSNTIELNVHRIADLSDRFVLFNDDTLLTRPVEPQRFFKNGHPCDMAVLNAIQPEEGLMCHVAVNNVACLNREHDARRVMGSNPRKWWSPCYGLYLVRNLFLSRYPRFTGFLDPHMPQPYLKDTFTQAWQKYAHELDATCSCQFRSSQNVNQWLLRYEQLVNACFEPLNVMADTKIFYSLTDTNFAQALTTVASGKKSMVCVNDGPVSDFELARKELRRAFEAILPEKSSFEND